MGFDVEVDDMNSGKDRSMENDMDIGNDMTIENDM